MVYMYRTNKLFVASYRYKSASLATVMAMPVSVKDPMQRS